MKIAFSALLSLVNGKCTVYCDALKNSGVALRVCIVHFMTQPLDFTKIKPNRASINIIG